MRSLEKNVQILSIFSESAVESLFWFAIKFLTEHGEMFVLCRHLVLMCFETCGAWGPVLMFCVFTMLCFAFEKRVL